MLMLTYGKVENLSEDRKLKMTALGLDFYINHGAEALQFLSGNHCRNLLGKARFYDIELCDELSQLFTLFVTTKEY
jgi:hypothetical protein